MEQIIELVSQKAGISKEQARIAVQTVLEFLKDRVPAAIAGQIDNVMKNPNSSPSVDDLAKGLGGMLGGKG